MSNQTVKLLASDGAFKDDFGAAVAISGSIIIVGARDDDTTYQNTGSAWLFDSSTGQGILLVPNDGIPDHNFGYSVAISGTTAIVGAMRDADNGWSAGAAYLFDTSTGQQVAKLLPADGAYQDRFGMTVGISGTTAIVGVEHDDDNGTSSGSAYLFDTTTGLEVAKLLPNDGGAFQYFGSSVAISGTSAIVGAREDDDNGPRSGSVYIFDTTTGQQIGKITPQDGTGGDQFGSSVAISGSTVIVGAPHDSVGSAYLFDIATGQEIAKLLPPDDDHDDLFGGSVVLNGIHAVVGAQHEKVYGTQSGAAYVFDAITGEQVTKLLPSDGAQFDYFGMRVAVSGSTAVVGAWGDDDLGWDSGSAYVFDLDLGIGTNYCGPANLNSSGLPATLSAFGSEVVAYKCVELEAAQTATDQFGMFLNSRTQGGSVPPGSQGLLCLGGGIGRYLGSVQYTGAAGSMRLHLDLQNTPTPNGPVMIQAGETWYFQAWFRDNNPGITSNFTDGVSITFQ